MSAGPEDLLNLIPKETINAAYKDAVSGPAKELSKLGVDVVKTARLILFPLQIAATLQDRVEGMLGRINKRVPEERRVEARPEIVGPCLEHMCYLTDRSDLWRMYEEVITKSVDSDSAGTIHPSFAHMISQLTRDEAWILYRLRDRAFTVVDTLDLNTDTNRFENRQVMETELPLDELYVPDQIGLLYSHMESLGLVEWPVLEQFPIKDGPRQTGIRRQSKMKLTGFGMSFVAACVPADGFEPKDRPPAGER